LDSISYYQFFNIKKSQNMKKVLVLLMSIALFNLNLIGQGELLKIEGAIQIESNSNPNPEPGTIRWTGADFEGWNGVIWASLTCGIQVGSVTDIDGNIYQTITIGTQEWMLENLKTTTFNDGVPITEWVFGDNWFENGGTFPYYQWAETGDLNNLYPDPLPFDFYGALYNEAAIASGKLAPIGWRIPTEQDFLELENHIANNGQSGQEAIALKSTSGWVSSIGNGTDDYGFNGLPNGYAAAGGTATGAQVISSWATTDVNVANQTRRIVQLYNQDTILYFDNAIQLGAGIRCIKE